jgi:hypothetical protein
MLMGAYWPARRESCEQAAERFSRFLAVLSQTDPAFSRWFLKAKRKSEATAPLLADPAEIASRLTVNRRDTDKVVMPELGFGIAAWNGDEYSLSAKLGAYSPRILNSVVISGGDHGTISQHAWREAFEAAIQHFDPEHAVVTTHELLDRANAVHPWEVGWLTYQRGQPVREHSVAP